MLMIEFDDDAIARASHAFVSAGGPNNFTSEQMRVALQAARTAPNQCDGCRAGMPLDPARIHRDAKGRPFMKCQKETYR